MIRFAAAFPLLAAAFLSGPVEPTPAWTAGDATNVNSWFAGRCSSAGDVNKDGYADIIVGAENYNGVGAAYVYLGGPGGLQAAAAWSAEGSQANAYFGGSVSSGDVNGDGFSDVVVGARLHDGLTANDGALFVTYGGPGGLPSGHSWKVHSYRQDAMLGIDVCMNADVNGDGYDDLAGTSGDGDVYVWYGSSGGLPVRPNGMAATPALILTTGSASACTIRSAGNVDGDLNPANGRALEDIVVSWGGGSNPVVFKGSVQGLDPAARWTVGSPAWTAAGAGDVNGDGFDDILVGNPGWDNGGHGAMNYGIAYIHTGGPGGPSAAPSATLTSDLAGSNFGERVAAAGDVNGDGYDDILVSAGWWVSPLSGLGAVYLYQGSSNGLLTASTWSAFGTKDTEDLGRSIASAGDVNDDGADDIIVGARAWLDPTYPGGRATVYHGISPAPRLPAMLNQLTLTGATIPDGGDSGGIGVGISAKLEDAQDQDVRLEVEIRPVGAPFTGTPTAFGGWVTAPATASATITALIEGGRCRWQLRARDIDDHASAWVPFGGGADDLNEADFVVTAAPPPPPVIPAEGSSSGCSLTCAGGGMGALLALVAVAAFRRRIGPIAACLVLAGCGGGNDGGGSGGGAAAPALKPVLEISPDLVSVHPGWTTRFTARLRHPDGSQETMPVTWSLLPPGIATIDASGLATGVAVGRAEVSAVSTLDPASRSMATLDVVDGSRVFAIDASAGLFSYAPTGGDRVAHPLPVAGGAIRGLAPAGNGIYLLLFDAALGRSSVWRLDLISGALVSVPGCAGNFEANALVADSQGRLYTITPQRTLYRFTPSSGQVRALKMIQGFALITLAVDDADNIYTLDSFPNLDWVIRHAVNPADDSVTSTTIVQNPLGQLNAMGCGLIVTRPGGPLYVAEGVHGRIHGGRDLDGDLSYTSPLEFEICSPVLGEPYGIILLGGDLVVNELIQHRMARLIDGDGDGSYSGLADSLETWAALPVQNADTFSNLAFWRPTAP